MLHERGTPRPLFLVGAGLTTAVIFALAAFADLAALYPITILAGAAFGAEPIPQSCPSLFCRCLLCLHSMLGSPHHPKLLAHCTETPQFAEKAVLCRARSGSARRHCQKFGKTLFHGYQVHTGALCRR